MSDSTMSFSDITVRTVRSRPGEHPAQIVEAIDVLLERLRTRWPELAWEIPYAGPWSGPVEERQRLVASRVAGDVDEHAVPERGAAFGLTAAQGSLRFHLIVTAGAPVVGVRAPLQQASLRLVAMDGSEISEESVSVVMAAMVSAWSPSMAVGTSRDLALADPVTGWEIPTGQQLWLSDPELRILGGSTITVQRAGTGTLLTADSGADVETIVTDMRRALTDAGLVEIAR